jgi:hypothetical protein
MIIKTNLRHIYSNVHLGFNIWEKILDNKRYKDNKNKSLNQFWHSIYLY